MAKATHATAYAERTLTTKLNSHEAEGLITRRHQCKLGATKNIGWESSELRRGINSPGKLNHKLFEFKSGELSVEIDDRSYADKLGGGILGKDRRKGVGNQVDSFLLTPSTDEDEQFSLCIRVSVWITVCSEKSLPWDPQSIQPIPALVGDKLVFSLLQHDQYGHLRASDSCPKGQYRSDLG